LTFERGNRAPHVCPCAADLIEPQATVNRNVGYPQGVHRRDVLTPVSLRAERQMRFLSSDNPMAPRELGRRDSGIEVAPLSHASVPDLGSTKRTLRQRLPCALPREGYLRANGYPPDAAHPTLRMFCATNRRMNPRDRSDAADSVSTSTISQHNL
jgi:hypothetical protein